MEIAKAFGCVIRKLRKECGYTQEQLALEVDLRRTFISVLELGQQQPTISTIFKLASGLNITSSKLIEMVELELNKGK